MTDFQSKVLEAWVKSEAAAVLYVNDEVDGAGRFYDLDSIVSVSALLDAGAFGAQIEMFDRREILNGS